MTADEWLELGNLLSEQHGQPAFIIRLNGEITLRSASGEVGKQLNTMAEVDQSWLELARLRQRGEPSDNPETGRSQESAPCTPPTVAQGLSTTEERSQSSSYYVTGHGTAGGGFFVAKPHANSSSMFFDSIGAYTRLPALQDTVADLKR